MWTFRNPDVRRSIEKVIVIEQIQIFRKEKIPNKSNKIDRCIETREEKIFMKYEEDSTFKFCWQKIKIFHLLEW